MSVRIGILYVLSGIGGGILSCLHTGSRDRVTVGASGALFGLLGASLSELIINWAMYTNKVNEYFQSIPQPQCHFWKQKLLPLFIQCSAFCGLFMVLVLNLIIGIIVPGVDQAAHYGGFFTGYFLGFILLMRPDYEMSTSQYITPGSKYKRRTAYKCYQYVLFLVALVTFLVG